MRMKKWRVTVMVFPPKPEETGDAGQLKLMQLRGSATMQTAEDQFPDGKPKTITFETVEGDEITDAMEGGFNLARMDYPGSKVVCLKATGR